MMGPMPDQERKRCIECNEVATMDLDKDGQISRMGPYWRNKVRIRHRYRHMNISKVSSSTSYPAHTSTTLLNNVPTDSTHKDEHSNVLLNPRRSYQSIFICFRPATTKSESFYIRKSTQATHTSSNESIPISTYSVVEERCILFNGNTPSNPSPFLDLR